MTNSRMHSVVPYHFARGSGPPCGRKLENENERHGSKACVDPRGQTNLVPPFSRLLRSSPPLSPPPPPWQHLCHCPSTYLMCSAPRDWLVGAPGRQVRVVGKAWAHSSNAPSAPRHDALARVGFLFPPFTATTTTTTTTHTKAHSPCSSAPCALCGGCGG